MLYCSIRIVKVRTFLWFLTHAPKGYNFRIIEFIVFLLVWYFTSSIVVWYWEGQALLEHAILLFIKRNFLTYFGVWLFILYWNSKCIYNQCSVVNFHMWKLSYNHVKSNLFFRQKVMFIYSFWKILHKTE